MTPEPVALVGLPEAGFAELAAGLGLKPFQVAEMYRWTYRRRTPDPLRWTNLPKAVREELARRCHSGVPGILAERVSSDGTRKFLLGLADGRRVEAVYIPDGARRTVCISSQVGCALRCAFCLTGTLGFTRNLSAGEILGQLFALESLSDLPAIPYNIVFMGMGEPLANRENLLEALGILQDPDGMAVSRRRVTVSTAGLADELEAFARDPRCPQLAISLGSARDEVRDRLMPVNRRYPLSRLRAALLALNRRNRERVSIEYTLLRGVNDGEADAAALARWARGLKAKVNLIHFNAAPGLPFEPSDEARTRAFQRVLLDAGLATSIRKSRGEDILAACGQLAGEGWAGPEGHPAT